jgi:hypothetical protein
MICLKQTSTKKLESPWEGPYLIEDVIPGGAYRLCDFKTGAAEKNPWNASQLCCFHPWKVQVFSSFSYKEMPAAVCALYYAFGTHQ